VSIGEWFPDDINPLGVHTMSKAINTVAIYAVFNDADNQSASFAERLMALGIDSRAAAKPFAIEWAAAKYNVSVVEGQRGAKLPRDSAAEKAMNRVLAVCFPSVDLPAKPATRQQVVVNKRKVSAIVEVCAGLTKAEVDALLRAVRDSISFE
jgi:hypothetical protein